MDDFSIFGSSLEHKKNTSFSFH